MHCNISYIYIVPNEHNYALNDYIFQCIISYINNVIIRIKQKLC